VIPFFDEHEIHIDRILNHRGTEYRRMAPGVRYIGVPRAIGESWTASPRATFRGIVSTAAPDGEINTGPRPTIRLAQGVSADRVASILLGGIDGGRAYTTMPTTTTMPTR